MKHQAFQRMTIGIVGFILMVLITACAGVSSAKNFSLTGSVTSVSGTNHSVILNVNGQLVTINGLTDQQVNLLQGQLGKLSSISIQATQNSDGSYTLVADQNSVTITSSNGTPVTTGTNGTPGANSTSGPNEPGTISFTGGVTSVSSSSIVVSMPDGSSLTMIINGQTKLSGFNDASPSVGQLIQVDARANTSDGSFTAMKLKQTDSNDNTVDYTGITTQAVAADNVIHFRIGNRDFSFTIVPGTTNLKDFNNSPQSIGNNVPVQVKVQFQGTSGTVQEVKNANS